MQACRIRGARPGAGLLLRAAVLGLLATLLGAGPSKGGTCSVDDFAVAIDVGHSAASPGATSARGIPEYEFNREFSRLLLARLHERGFKRSFIINDAGEDLPLRERAERANRAKADLLVSVHHDSVQPFYLSSWTYGGKELSYCDRFRGYSVFVSGRQGAFGKSLRLASLVGRSLRNAGLTPSLHHAEQVEGEKRTLLDGEKGIYRNDDLTVLRSAGMAAILLECGIIVNREEEAALMTPEYRERMADALVSAFEAFCCDR